MSEPAPAPPPAAAPASPTAPASPAWGLITIACGLMLTCYALLMNWGSAPSSQFMLRMATIGLIGGVGIMGLGVFAVIAPKIRLLSGIGAIAALIGFILLTGNVI